MAVFKQRKTWRAKVVIKGKVVADKAGFSKKREAQQWHDATRLSFSDGKKPVTSEKEYRFDDLLKKFEDIHLSEMKSGGRRRYEIDIRLRIRPFFQFRSLGALDPLVLEAFKEELKRSGLSNKSINNCVGTLNGILRRGVEWRMMKEMPHVLKPMRVEKNHSYLWWDDPDDLRKFCTTAQKLSHRYYPAFLLGLETGMRLGEIVGLSKKDIDFANGRILVWRQWLEKDRDYGSPKNGLKRYVYFEVGGELSRVLLEAVKRSPDPDVVFVTRNGKRVLPRTLAGQIFKRVIRAACVPDICFHGLRHTFASWYMMEHDDINSLKAMLGHSDIKTTQRYAHLSKRHRRKPLTLSSIMAQGGSENGLVIQ